MRATYPTNSPHWPSTAYSAACVPPTCIFRLFLLLVLEALRLFDLDKGPAAVLHVHVVAAGSVAARQGSGSRGAAGSWGRVQGKTVAARSTCPTRLSLSNFQRRCPSRTSAAERRTHPQSRPRTCSLQAVVGKGKGGGHMSRCACLARAGMVCLLLDSAWATLIDDYSNPPTITTPASTSPPPCITLPQHRHGERRRRACRAGRKPRAAE